MGLAVGPPLNRGGPVSFWRGVVLPGPARRGRAVRMPSVPMSQGRDDAVARIERELRAAGSPERAAGSQNYLKSTLEFTGTTVPQARAIVTAWRREHPDLTGLRLTAIASKLWERPYFECRLAAVILLTDRRNLLQAADATLIERMLRTSGTWALVDGLAAEVMGDLVERKPELTTTLDRWATDENFWIRRSAMLSLLVPLRRGD